VSIMTDKALLGIDSNVLLRYIVCDDERQAEIATQFMNSLSENRKGFISIVVLIETIWVLSRAYGHKRQEICNFIDLLLSSSVLQVQFADVWERVLHDEGFQDKDLGDAVIAVLGLQADCIETVTFDKKASKIEGMRLLK